MYTGYWKSRYYRHWISFKHNENITRELSRHLQRLFFRYRVWMQLWASVGWDHTYPRLNHLQDWRYTYGNSIWYKLVTRLWQRRNNRREILTKSRYSFIPLALFIKGRLLARNIYNWFGPIRFITIFTLIWDSSRFFIPLWNKSYFQLGLIYNQYYCENVWNHTMGLHIQFFGKLAYLLHDERPDL